jgi:hypothetical protein
MTLVIKPTQIIGDTRLTGGDIKPLNRRSEKVGKIFKSTKEKITWSFAIKRSSYAVELLASNLSGKKRIKVNGKLLEITKADKDIPPADGALPTYDKHSDRDLQFAVDGIQFEVIMSTQKSHDLVINGHSFAELNEERVGNIACLIKESKIEHFAAKVVMSRQSSLHVLTMNGSDTELQSSQEGGNTQTPENPPEASHRSSRLSARSLRRSDASVKDINVPCLPSQLSQRGFRRSEASVKDLATIGTEGRNSCVRGFRRSNAIVRHSGESFGSTTSITSPSENSQAQTMLQLPQSNFDSTLSLTNFDSTSFESIPLNEVNESEGTAASVLADGALVSKRAENTVRVSTGIVDYLENKIQAQARKSHANSFVEALRP